MMNVLTTRDVCQELNIPMYKLQYLFDSGKIPDVQRTTSGNRVYSEDDIKMIREVILKVCNK